jgi:AbrB family looped-hinge helix DNA binding protein
MSRIGKAAGSHDQPGQANAVADFGEETVRVRLSPYWEAPTYYRTVAKLEGHRREFPKSEVSVVYRDSESIVLLMAKTYADTRVGISSLIVGGDGGEVLSGNPQREASSGGFSESAAEWDNGLPERLDVRVGPAGRIVIPAIFREAMQVKEGDRLMARVEDGELRLISPKMGVRKAQKLVRELIPGDDSLVDALVAERREEARREMEDG